MDLKSDEGVFLGYSTNIRAYRAYNKYTKTMMESIIVVIGDTPEDKQEGEDEDYVSPQQIDVPTDVPHMGSGIESERNNFLNILKSTRDHQS